MKIQVTSTAFAPGAGIPAKYTGDGANVSPPLEWSGLPQGTQELALIVDDPDAPTAEPFVHWVLYQVPASAGSLPEGMSRQPALANGMLQGKNGFGKDKTGYDGPAPPPGKIHHYHFALYALDEPLKLAPGLVKPAVLAAMSGHVLDKGELVGTYRR